MYQWIRALSFYNNPKVQDSSLYWMAVFYFLLLIIVGNFILLSLFTAILLQNFDDGEGEKKKADHEKKLEKI